MILAVRTDSENAYLALIEDMEIIAEKSWQPGKALSQELHAAIHSLMEKCAATLGSIEGIIFYEGPGSYTSLRIGCSVVNALGYSLSIPLQATSGDEWIQKGIKVIKHKHAFSPVVPVYGGNTRVTNPSK